MRHRNTMTWKLFLALIGLLAVIGCSQQEKEPAADATTVTDEAAPHDSVVIELAGRDSVSVFELLEESHEVDYKSSAMGPFVTAIDSISQGEGAYWIYMINDTVAPVAADKAVTRDGDRVTWHLRK
jgi:hypothetical protein